MLVSVELSSPRRLGHQHLAFVRSWAEGLDMLQAWNRYMAVDGVADGRRARGELQRLLTELRSLARAHCRPEVAALLQRDPDAMVERRGAQASQAPTLEAFRAQQPADYYSEAELLDLYRAEHGASGRQAQTAGRRRQRLRERLVAALQWLDSLAARPPRPADPVAAWLDERVAARLQGAGLSTLAQLMAHIGRRGPRWHRGIARVGPESASRVVRWLQDHAGSLGALPASSLAAPGSRPPPAAVEPRAGIVPLERFAPPASLDGAHGNNRAAPARCKLAALNDLEAIQAWLRLRVAGTHTWRAYRREAERFLLWAVAERRKPLSSLDGDDCVAYRDFLARPGPSWTGPRGSQRWSDSWRPFEGPLAPRSAQAAVTILRSLCGWLVRRHYLDSNPWDDVPARPDAPAMPQLRALSARQWGMVQDWLDSEPPCPATRRLRCLLTLAYTTGMRLAELAAARVGWLRHEELDDGRWVWSILVLGKRQKWREVPLPERTVESFRECLTDRGLTAEILSNDGQTPLVARLDGGGPLSAGRIYEVLCDAFERCAARVAATDPRAALRIRTATTHWLRHTHGSHAVALGVSANVLQANLGHTSLATTSIYVQAEKRRRHEEIERAFGTRDGPLGPVPAPGVL
jgi:site-specific recombinase XerD